MPDPIRMRQCTTRDQVLPLFTCNVIDASHSIEKGGLRVNTCFRHHRQRGPVNALQMRLQG